MMEVTLHEGDMLYFPRGIIHEAVALETGSAHVTISTYQQCAWVDLLKSALPMALDRVAHQVSALRSGLPWDILRNFGTAVNSNAERRESLLVALKDMMNQWVLPQLTSGLMAVMDCAVDKFAVDFVTSRLGEVEEAGHTPDDGDDEVPTMHVLLIDPSFIRVELIPNVIDEAKSDFLIHDSRFNNPRLHMMSSKTQAILKEWDPDDEELACPSLSDLPQPLRLPFACLPAVQELVRSWPRPVDVEPLLSPEHLTDFICALKRYELLQPLAVV